MSKTFANLLLLSAGAIWGMGFLVQKTAMDDIGPMLFIALRFLLAGLVVTPFAIAELRKQSPALTLSELAPHKGPFFMVGLAFFLGMAFQQIGLIETSVTNAGFLTALYVIMVPLLMVGVLRVSQPFIIWPACVLALGGIYLLSGGDLSSLNSGDMLVILCAFFWAVHVILTGRVGHSTGLPVSMACCQFYITAILAFLAFTLSAGFAMGEAIPSMTQLSGALPEILFAGVIAGGLGFTLQAIGQRYTSESAAAVLISTESLFAALFGALFLAERLQAAGYIGCALIFAAILIVELVPAKQQAKEQASTKKMPG